MSWPKRRTLIVDRSLQYRFFAIALFHFVIILFVIIGSIFFPLSLQLNDASLSWMERNEIASRFLSLHSRIWPPTLIALVFITLHWTVFSHKIAGPLYRFRKVFHEISEGNLSIQARIRKNDCLKNESSCIDDMILALRTKISDLDIQQQEIARAFQDLKQAYPGHLEPSFNQKVLHLESQIEISNILLKQFQTTNQPKPSVSVESQSSEMALSSPTASPSSVNY